MSRYVAYVIRQWKKPNPDSMKQNARGSQFGLYNTNAPTENGENSIQTYLLALLIELHISIDYSQFFFPAGYQAYDFVAKSIKFLIPVGLATGILIYLQPTPKTVNVNTSEEGFEEAEKQRYRSIDDKFEKLEILIEELDSQIEQCLHPP